MSARVYAGGCLTAKQLAAIGSPSILSATCSSAQVNTCGLSARGAVFLYGFYDPKLGYGEGDRVIVLSALGERYTVYESMEEILSPAGVFDPELWSEVCKIYPSGKDGLGLEGYVEMVVGGYEVGDRAYRRTRCGGQSCVYEAVADFTLTGADLLSVPDSSRWKLLFCLSNGEENQCEKTRPVCSNPFRKAVLLGAEGDIACVPVERESYVRFPRAGTLYVEELAGSLLSTCNTTLNSFTLSISGGVFDQARYEISTDGGETWQETSNEQESLAPGLKLYRSVASNYDSGNNTDISNIVRVNVLP